MLRDYDSLSNLPPRLTVDGNREGSRGRSRGRRWMDGEKMAFTELFLLYIQQLVQSFVIGLEEELHLQGRCAF